MTRPIPLLLIPRTREARRAWLVGLLGALILALAWDRAIFLAISETDHARRALLEQPDWFRLLRVTGSIWFWLVIGSAWVLLDWRGRDARLPRRPSPWRRGGRVLLAAGLAGILAELCKPIIGMQRPINSDGYHDLLPLFAGFSDGAPALGMPSSHAAVAFGGALMLGMQRPRLLWLGLALAPGCGLTRVLVGAHFTSDVLVGAVIGWIGAWLAWRAERRVARRERIVASWRAQQAAEPPKGIRGRSETSAPAARTAALAAAANSSANRPREGTAAPEPTREPSGGPAEGPASATLASGSPASGSRDGDPGAGDDAGAGDDPGAGGGGVEPTAGSGDGAATAGGGEAAGAVIVPASSRRPARRRAGA